jgi:transcriptional regulator with XRE-family HTH domain
VGLLYDDLIEIHRPPEPSKRNAFYAEKSVLVGKSGFLTFLGLTGGSPVGGELFDRSAIDAWLASRSPASQPGGVQSADVRAANARLNTWAQRAQKLTGAVLLPNDPRERLKTVIENALTERGMSERQIASVLGVSTRSVNQWLHGRTLLSTATAQRLERNLSLTPGTLDACVVSTRRTTSFCPADLIPKDLSKRARGLFLNALDEGFPLLPRGEQEAQTKRVADAIRNNPHRQARSQQILQSYGVAISNLPKRTQMEIETFLAYKKAQNPSAERTAKGFIRSDTSLKNWRTLFSQFYGWCLLPTREMRIEQDGVAPETDALIGLGLMVEEVTIGLFAVPSVVDAFLAWRFSPARYSTANSAMQQAIGLMASLVRAETGWLTQHPELVARVPDRLRAPHQADHARWIEKHANAQTHLAEALQYVRSTRPQTKAVA